MVHSGENFQGVLTRLGGFGSNFGSNFAVATTVVTTVPPTKTVTADLCVNNSVKEDLCV